MFGRNNYHNKKTRICSRCKNEYPNNKNNFYIKNKSQHLLYSYCKKCYSKIQIEKHADLKHQYLEYMKSFECKICKYNQYEHNLSFHHLDPFKKEVRIAATNRSVESIKEELDKCIIVCFHCHNNIHKGLHPEYLQDTGP